jgi:hypothetical protein
MRLMTVGLALLLAVPDAGSLAVSVPTGGDELKALSAVASFAIEDAFALLDPGEERLLVCLGFRQADDVEDPAASSLSGLATSASIRKASSCQVRAEGAVEVATGAPALILIVGPVERRTADELWVRSKYFRSRSRAGQRVYRVVREGSDWSCVGEIVQLAPRS